MGTAKYQRVIEWIENRISSGELKEGDRLETEQEISQLFGISRQTVRHGLAFLEKRGTLEKIQGSGSYVKGRPRPGEERIVLSRTVSIISSYVDSYIFPKILESMVKTLERAGYSSRIMFTGNQVETERRLLLRLLEDNGREPLIVEPVMSGLPNPNLPLYEELKKKGVPVLFFNSYYRELEAPHVSMDDAAAGRIATEYLIARGHVKIGAIFKSDDGQGRCRYQGYLEALQKAGIPLEEKRIRWIDTLEQKQLTEESGCSPEWKQQSEESGHSPEQKQQAGKSGHFPEQKQQSEESGHFPEQKQQSEESGHSPEQKQLVGEGFPERNLFAGEDGRLLERLADCTACVCYNDEVAHALTEICKAQGIRIPEELSIVSIDNSDLARLNSVPLTSVAHPMDEMGQRTAENLLRLIRNPKYSATFEFVPKLVVRDSVVQFK